MSKKIMLKIWLLIHLDSRFHSEFSASVEILAQWRYNWNQQFIHMWFTTTSTWNSALQHPNISRTVTDTSWNEQVITRKSIKMLFIIILTLSLEVIAVVSINPRVYSFPLYTIYRSPKRARTEHIVNSILLLYQGQTSLRN